MRKSLTISTIVLGLCSSAAFAQDTEVDGQIAQDPAAQTAAPTCFKLVQPADSCLLVGRQIGNTQYPSFNVVDLNGAWIANGQPGAYIYVYGDGNSIFVDMTLFNRPDGFGNLIDASTLSVVFPDDRDYTGKLESPTTIRWSNGTVWTKQ